MTSNLDKRVREHNSSSSKSAKYLRSKRPVCLVYSVTYPEIKTAMNRELQVKKWTNSPQLIHLEGGMQYLIPLQKTIPFV